MAFVGFFLLFWFSLLEAVFSYPLLQKYVAAQIFPNGYFLELHIFPPFLFGISLPSYSVSEDKDERSGINFGICEAVWEWASGTSFLDIIEVTKAREGTLIRDIVRVDNLCREFRTAARGMGDTTLQEKMAECSNLVRRDVVFCQSIYLD